MSYDLRITIYEFCRYRLAHGERDYINIITLARGEIMLRMVKLRGAQLNQRLPALVKSPCGVRWWEGLGK